jgi:CHAT domain-containing protein/tetratricopeptide (TPR) repeat protein
LAVRMKVGIRVSPAVLLVAIQALLCLPAFAATASEPSNMRCIDAHPRAARILDRSLTLDGSTEVRVDLPAGLPRIDTVIYALEQGVDVEIDVRDGAGASLAMADSPVPRTGLQRAWLPASARIPTSLVVRGREHAGVRGSVRLLAVSMADGREAGACAAIERSLAAADHIYASARASAKSTAGAPTAPRGMLESAAAAYEKAVPQAASRMAEAGDLELTLAAINYYELQDWAKSEKWAQQAANTFQAAGKAYARARAQALLAAAWLEISQKSSSAGRSSDTPADSRSQLDRTRALLGQLERFHAARNEPYDRALQINNMGISYLTESRFEPALAQFTKAQVEFERLHETQRMAVALQNIALCEWGLGRLSAAVPQLDRALGLMTPQPYPDLYFTTLSNSALAHHAAGKLDESLRLHGQALDLATRLLPDRARGRTYYGMGTTYYAIGDRDLAARFLRSALEILTPDVDARGRVGALRALAVIEHEMGQFLQASSHNSEALRLATAASARSRILLRLAADYVAQGNSVAARGMLDPLAAFPPNGDVVVQALARAQRARLQRMAGALDDARRDAQAAIATLREFEAVTDEFDARVELARIEHDAGSEEKSLAALARALDLTEEITAQTANPEYRASIAQSVRPALDLKIDLLWRRHERLAAEKNAEGARAVAMESLRTADDSRAIAFDQLRAQRLRNSADPKVAELQRTVATLYRDIAERRFQLSTREDRTGANDLIAATLRNDIARLRAQLGVANTELAARAAPRAGRAAPAAREDGIAGVLAAAPEKAFVEYWVGKSYTYAWAISRGQLTWHRLAPSSNVERIARGLHESMRSYATTSVRSRVDQSAELYRLAFAPLKPLLAGTRDLTIVPDGPLHYVPFLTLRDASSGDKPYLVQNYGIAFAPALRLMSSTPPPRPASWAESRMLLVADPVYGADDPRLQRTVRTRTNEESRFNDLLRMRGSVDAGALERLISSARESERIRALPALGRVDRFEGLDATRSNVLAQDFAAYRFIHIASHGIIDSEIPQLSALILGAWGRDGRVPDQYVRAGDLLGRTFDAEVVVLSACDTALGREFAGEGLMGLRYAALARGARSVVGSLWPVSDAIAADLMTDMYRYITADAQPVELALSSAIRAALVRSPSLDPALWGPFAVYVAND